MKQLYILSIGLLLLSCNVADDFDDVKMGINTSMPIGNLKLDDKKLFELANISPENLYTNSNDILEIRDIINLNLLDDSKFNDVMFVKFEDINEPIGNTGSNSGQSIILPPEGETITYHIKMGPGERIDNLVFMGGYITFEQNAILSDVTCTIDEITKNGNPVTIKEGQTIVLDNSYTVKPIPGTNDLTFRYKGVIHAGTQQNAVIKFNDVEASTIQGYFGHKEMTKSNATININGSTNDFLAQTESFILANPNLTINISNSYDIPTAVIVEEVLVDNIPIELVDTYNTTHFLINKGVRTITIDNKITISGSGLTDAIDKQSDKITVVIRIILNPTDNDLLAPQGTAPINSTNYFNRESILTSEINYNIPFDGMFKGINYTENFDFNLNTEKIDLNEAQFAVTGTNTFPMFLELDLFIVTKNNSEILVTERPLVVSSTADNQKPGNIVPFVLDDNNYELINLRPSALEDLKHATKLRFKIRSSTLDADKKRMVKIYSGSELNLYLMLGAKGELSI